MRGHKLWLAALALAVGLPASAQTFEGTLSAPDFPPGLEWINVERPLTLADLRGKVVLLDFWTYGCINCLHVIPELQRLEAKYGDALAVIGVHSGKFDQERDTENIRRIAERYGRDEPIVNDRDFAIWQSYFVRAWPTFILIDPEGRVLGAHEGEGIYELFDEVIAGMIEVAEARGSLVRGPLALAAPAPALDSPLRFPGKVLADEAGGRLFIADTGHDRVVVTDLGGTVLNVIGGPQPGFADGGFAEARLRGPQGLALAGERLFIADTGNHAVRLADLGARTVTTVAGTGEQGYVQLGAARLPALETALNSPWDLLWLDGWLYIAMAGTHQLWRLEPETGALERFAGSGDEALVDGPLLEAGLNQPSGLASDGRRLYVADPEASAVRVADPEAGTLTTLVGTGLFDFGDADGVGEAARLQHPLGIAYAGGRLYLADTYNHKVKVLEPGTREVRTLAGGERGWRDGAEARFYEPGGLSAAGGKLYVADTNNHAVRVLELASGAVGTVALSDPERRLALPGAAFAGRTLELPPQQAGAGEGALALHLSLPDGYKVNDLAPLSLALRSDGEALRLNPATASVSVREPEYPLELSFPVTLAPGRATLEADLSLYYCQAEAEALCLVDQVRLRLPLTVSADGAPEVRLAYRTASLDELARLRARR